jgi:C4-type Zn-finger protein
MITAYLVGIPAYYEGEDIEIRYSIYRDEELICKKSIYQDYIKPAAVGIKAYIALLEEFQQIDGDEFTVIINDPALNELIRGTSTTKNGAVLKALSQMKRKVDRLNKKLTVIDVSNHYEELK